MKLEAQATITAADTTARTISGTIAVYGAVGNTSAGPTVIKAGAITVPDKVVMLVSHDSDRPVGLLASHSDDDSQMVGTFSLPLTTSADNALAEAGAGIRDGLSVGLEVDAHEVDADGTLVVTAATLREVSLVTFPAFTAARVSDVAASETPEVSDTTPVTDEPPTESENPAVDDTTPDTVADVTASADLPRITVQDAFPYREGVTASFFRDMLNARHDVQAAQRVHVAQEMMTAAQKTPSVSQVIPPGYRPDMYQGEEVLGQPIASSVSHMSISDATPFKIPVFGSSASLTADHVEGVNPTDGTLDFDEITVTPKAVSGKFTASREMLDAANPNLDAIIMKAMAEDYANKVENEAAAALLTAATAGTNATAGKVSVALGEKKPTVR